MDYASLIEASSATLDELRQHALLVYKIKDIHTDEKGWATYWQHEGIIRSVLFNAAVSDDDGKLVVVADYECGLTPEELEYNEALTQMSTQLYEHYMEQRHVQ